MPERAIGVSCPLLFDRGNGWRKGVLCDFCSLGTWVSRPSMIWTRRLAHCATCSSWVTTANVSPCWFKAVKSSRISAVAFESRLPVGSSHKSRLGEPTKARAMATLCCSPPESLVGRKSTRWLRPTRSSAANARARRPCWGSWR